MATVKKLSFLHLHSIKYYYIKMIGKKTEHSHNTRLIR